MTAPHCWLCNRKMQLFHERGYWRLWCSPCAASYICTRHVGRDAFLAGYAAFYAEKRGDGQLQLTLEVDG